MSSPNLNAPSYAQEKTFFRVGTKYARVEEAPDTEKGNHGLFIVNEPDAWMINLFQKSGRHMVDRGPTFDARLPIFTARSISTVKITGVGIRQRVAFFTKKNAQSGSETIGGKPPNRYDSSIEGHKLILWTEAESKKPLRVSLIYGDQTQTFEYVSYEDNLEFDPSLFRPPTGIVIVEPRR